MKMFKKVLFIAAFCGMAAPALAMGMFKGLSPDEVDSSGVQNLSFMKKDTIIKIDNKNENYDDLVSDLLENLTKEDQENKFLTLIEKTIENNDLEGTKKLLRETKEIRAKEFQWPCCCYKVLAKSNGAVHGVTYDHVADSLLTHMGYGKNEDSGKVSRRCEIIINYRMIKAIMLLFLKHKVISFANMNNCDTSTGAYYNNPDFIQDFVKHGLKINWSCYAEYTNTNPFLFIRNYQHMSLLELLLKSLPRAKEAKYFKTNFDAGYFSEVLKYTEQTKNRNGMRLFIRLAINNKKLKFIKDCVEKEQNKQFKNDMQDLIRRVQHEIIRNIIQLKRKDFFDIKFRYK